MKIDEQTHGAVILVRPRGSVAGDGADTLRSRLLDARDRALGRLVLDLGDVPFLDGQAIEAMLDVTDALARSGRALKLCNENEVVREVLELTDVSSAFEHFGDVNSAVRSFL